MNSFYDFIQDNPVGSGTGKYKNHHHLFYAKPQHALLVPIWGLIRADEYLSSMVMQGEHNKGQQKARHEFRSITYLHGEQ